MVSARAHNFLAALLAFLAGIAVPGTSIGHGIAHAHAREASPDHHTQRSGSHSHQSEPAVVDGDDPSGHDHAHPQLDRSTAARLVDHSPIASTPVAAVDSTITGVLRETVVAAAARPRADPSRGP